MYHLSFGGQDSESRNQGVSRVMLPLGGSAGEFVLCLCPIWDTLWDPQNTCMSELLMGSGSHVLIEREEILI